MADKATHTKPDESTAEHPVDSKPAPSEKSLNGVKGWLMVLTVVLGIGVAFNLIGLSQNNAALSQPDIKLAFDLYPSLKSIIYYEMAVLAAAAGLGIWSIILVAKHKRLAKKVITGLLAGVLITGFVDVAWVSSVLGDNPEAMEAADVSGQIGRAIVAAAIWIPYVWVSKRVKATLTEA